MKGTQHLFPLEAISFHKAKYLSMQQEQNRVCSIVIIGMYFSPWATQVEQWLRGKHYDKHQDAHINKTRSLPSRSSQSNAYNE